MVPRPEELYLDRYRLEISNYSKYPKENRWNFSIQVTDTKNALNPQEDVSLGSVSIDFDGDIEKFKTQLTEKLRRFVKPSDDQLINNIKKILTEV